MRSLLLMLGLVCAVGSVHAEKIYRWTGPDGKTYFGDVPAEGARDVRPFDRRVGTGAVAPTGTTAPQTVAASEPECANKRAQLSTYKNAVRLVERDSLGREREFTSEEREQLIARAQSELESKCGDQPAE